MKITKLFALFLLVTNISFANIPVENIEHDFDQINKIEKYVNEHPGTTYQQLKSENSELLKDISIHEEDHANFVLVDSDTLGIPPFWWGFCLGFWGILIVYIISDNDKSATKKALNGCLTMGGLFAAFYIILFAVGLTSSTSLYYW